MTLDDLAATLDQAPLGVLVVEQGQIAWINQTLANLLALSKDDLLGDSLADSRLSQWLDDSIEFETAGGDQRFFKRHSTTLSNGFQAHYFLEITDQITLQNRLNDLEVRDPVTGLLNRRAILKELDRQTSRSRRYQNPLSVIRLTLETRVEPTRHQEILKTLSAALKDKLRWADEVGMVDDNTFLLVLPETSLADAKELAVKLLSDRAAFDFNISEGKVRYGVAAWSKGDDLRKLLSRAEKDQDLDLSALLS